MKREIHSQPTLSTDEIPELIYCSIHFFVRVLLARRNLMKITSVALLLAMILPAFHIVDVFLNIID